MSLIIKTILETNQPLLQQRKLEVQFKVDHEGKGILNRLTSRFYTERNLDKSAIADIIVTSYVVILKMLKMKDCGWPIGVLNERLNNSIEYFETRNNIDLSSLFEIKKKRTREFTEEKIKKKSTPEFIEDIDEKYPPKFRAIDGHRVHSKAELLIDNFLYTNGIIHAYGKKLPDACRYCDFYIPSGKGIDQPVYIEYWGLDNDKSYLARKNAKLQIYRQRSLQLIELTDADIENLEDALTEKLRLFNVVVE